MIIQAQLAQIRREDQASRGNSSSQTAVDDRTPREPATLIPQEKLQIGVRDPVPILEYAEQHWKMPGTSMRAAYERVAAENPEGLAVYNVRGDNYCAVRAVLFTLMRDHIFHLVSAFVFLIFSLLSLSKKKYIHHRKD